MWIKTMEGNFVNTDNVMCIQYDGHTDATEAVDRHNNYHYLCRGDYSNDIIQNIISGTKVMEVR